MTSDRFVDTLQRAAAPPRYRLDLEQLSSRATARRRSRRVLLTSVVAVVVVLVVVAVSTAFGGAERGPLRTPPANDGLGRTASNPGNGVSWAVPERWQDNPLVDTGSPAGTTDQAALEVLAAGTAARPDGLTGVTCVADGASATDAFVSVREMAGPLVGAGRPSRFSPADLKESNPFCEPPADAAVRLYRTTFDEHGRYFVAFLALGTDVAPETRVEALGLLDSVQVAAAEPADAATVAAISDAFDAAARVEDSASARDAIDQSDRIPDVSRQLAALGTNPGDEGERHRRGAVRPRRRASPILARRRNR
jgi:hypothetical protein